MSVAINRALLLKTRSTPTEVVSSGEAYFWLEGSTLKYKAEDQNTYTLATGVTPEEVQDIVGAFITSGNNRLTVNYNDAGNVLTLTVVEANIIHQNLSGAGTNTHAQIDSHIASQANPHNVTTAQIGAVPTTRQVNSGTGLQGGGDLSANRTLSLTNTGVTAGTYGPNNLVGFTVDAQGRITSAQNGPALVIGDNFEQFLDNTPFATSSPTEQVAASFTTTSKQPGLYRVQFKWNFTTNSTTSSTTFRMYIDGAQQDGDVQLETKDTTDDVLITNWFYINLPTTTTHTLQLRCFTENGMTVTVSLVRAEMWRAN